MSDQDTITRTISSKCFGTIVKILPLEKSVPTVEGFENKIENERKFLTQLTDSKNIEPYEIPIKIRAELRKYQKDGVSWLAFLNKFNLSGILCDDMGLGKTLQCLCILASDAENRKIENEKTKDCPPLPDLVICPPTLVGHWYHEVLKFTDLKPIQYSGTPAQRKK
jgi:TATA-binding protein-associated factor